MSTVRKRLILKGIATLLLRAGFGALLMWLDMRLFWLALFVEVCGIGSDAHEAVFLLAKREAHPDNR